MSENKTTKQNTSSSKPKTINVKNKTDEKNIKAQSPKNVTVKVAEPLLVEKEDIKETVELENDVAASSVVLESLKLEEKSPVVKSYNFTVDIKTLIGICLFIVAFTISYGVIAKTSNEINNVATKEFETTSTSNTTEVTTKTTSKKTTETTTEITTIVTTQAPEVNYTKKAVASQTVVKNKVVKLSVPYVSQLPKYPTGCEAASATMVLKYWGYNTSIDTVVSTMPSGLIYKKKGKAYGPSIYEKFVGDPRCTYTSTTPGYGAFAPVVTGTLNSLLDSNKHVAKNITGSSLATLFSYIDKGYPVIVWSTYMMKEPTKANAWYIEGSYEKKPFEYPRGTHVTVLYGYDNNSVYIQDPYYDGKYVSFSQSLFSARYNLLGCQAVVVVPQDTPTTTKATTVATTETTTEEVSTTEEETTANETTTEESTTDISETTTITEG